MCMLCSDAGKHSIYVGKDMSLPLKPHYHIFESLCNHEIVLKF